MSRALRRVLPVLALVLSALALTSPASAASSVTGTATDPDGHPVSGAAYLYLVGSGNGGGNSFTGGSFSVNAPAAGDYQLQVRASTMDGLSRWYVAGNPAGSADRTAATVLTLDGTSSVPVDAMQFPAIATLSGHVTNGDGDPMAGVTVLRNRLGTGTSTTTDAQGFYDFGYVLPGSTAISVNGDGTWAGDRVTVVVDDSTHYTEDLVMRAPARLAGAVTDADTGDPVALLNVLAYQRVNGSLFYTNSAFTDATGHFDIGGLGAGDFVLQYYDDLGGYPVTWNGGDLLPGPGLTTSAGATTTHDEALTQKADPRPGKPLSGVVTDGGGSPLVGITVTAEDTGGGSSLDTTTDRSGRWAIDAPDGTYRLHVVEGDWLKSHEGAPTPWFPEYYPDAWAAGDAATVTVAGDLHPGLDLDLARAGVITLDVRDGTGSTDLNAGYRVVTPAGVTVFDHAPTAYDGHALDVLLRPGSWKVLVAGRSGLSTNDPQLVPRWFGGGTSLSTATTTTVAAGELVDGGTLRLPRRLQATTAPRIKGSPHVGKKLKATKGAWNQMTGTTFTFTWLRGATAVGHAASYRVKAADAGSTLKVKVRATNGDLSTTVTKKVRIP
ncbi:MAG: carboxypeptidase-like regulatory domain-containing protein [Nocardioidaceae bacterium]